MKEKFLFVFVFFYIQSFSQIPDSVDFKIYASEKLLYYDSLLAAGASLEGTGYKEFKHFFLMWNETVLHDGSLDTSRYYRNKLGDNWVDANWKSQSVWTEIGPLNTPEIFLNTAQNRRIRGTGRIYQIEIDEINNRMFACSPLGGLYYSNNEGTIWNNGGTDYLPRVIGVGTFAIAKNSNAGNTWFIATGEGEEQFDNFGGLYRTTDGGANWFDISQGLPQKYLSNSQIRTLLIHPQNENILFAIFKKGVYRTQNALTTNPSDIVWQPVLAEIGSPASGGNGYFFDARFMPGTPSTIVVSGEKVFISTNDGNPGSWNEISTYTPPVNRQYKSICRFSQSDPSLVYFVVQKSGAFDLYKYDFDNNQFTLLNDGFSIYPDYYQYERKHGFEVNPTNSNELIL